MLEGPCISGLNQGFVYMSHLKDFSPETLQESHHLRGQEIRNVSANIPLESPGTPLWGPSGASFLPLDGEFVSADFSLVD